MSKVTTYFTLDNLLKFMAAMTLIFLLIFPEHMGPVLLLNTIILIALMGTVYLSKKVTTAGTSAKKSVFLLLALLVASFLTVNWQANGQTIPLDLLHPLQVYLCVFAAHLTGVVYLLLTQHLNFKKRDLGLLPLKESLTLSDLTTLALTLTIAFLILNFMAPGAFVNAIEHNSPATILLWHAVLFMTAGLSGELILRGALFSYLREKAQGFKQPIIGMFLAVTLTLAFSLLCRPPIGAVSFQWVIGALLMSLWGCLTRLQNKSILYSTVLYTVVNTFLLIG